MEYQGIANEKYWNGFGMNTATNVQPKLEGVKDIPDRRKNEAYKSYDIMADDCRQKMYNQEVKEISDIGTWLDKIQIANYLIVYTIADDYKNMENYKEVNEKRMLLGICLDDIQGANAWVVKNRIILYSSSNQAW